MKKIIVMFGLVLATLAISAQNPPAKAKINEEERAKLKEMRKDLNLSEEQKTKLKEIHKERKANAEARKAMTKEQRRAANQETKAKVDNVLNDEQDKKMSEIRKKRKEFRKN